MADSKCVHGAYVLDPSAIALGIVPLSMNKKVLTAESIPGATTEETMIAGLPRALPAAARR